MKKIETWLNEKDYKRFIRKARSKRLGRYAFLKEIVLEKLDVS
jgi:hypothetical protein